MLKNPGSVAMLAFCGMLVCACSSPMRSAPVIDRSAGPARAAPTTSSGAPVAASANPGADAGAAIYIVKPGDTLYSIALAHGRDYRDVAAWNQIEDPRVLRVGQSLRVSPPDSTGAASSGPQTTAVQPIGGVESRPLGTPLPPVAKIDPKPAEAKPPEGKPADAPKTEPRANDSDIAWIWPAQGALLDTFKEPNKKGIDIAAKAGDPVIAAADGQVVYAGAGLRGYGNLIIVKHSDNFISAYAHNSKLLVPADAAVKRGQKIAEAGSSDADRPKLHFEIRRRGVPVDPLKYLPDKAP